MISMHPGTIREIATQFNVSISTVSRVRKRYRGTGSSARLPVSGGCQLVSF